MTGPTDNNPQGQNTAPDENDEASGGYAGSQLRMARRKARRLGLEPRNGRHAIQLLEERGISIDDSEVNIIEAAQAAETLSSSQPEAGLPARSSENIPALKKAPMPPVPFSNDERKKQVKELEEKIRTRRTKNLRRMLRRFLVYVIFPTVLYGYYIYNVATPLYAAHSIISIEQSSGALSSKAGSLLAGTSFASQPDSIRMQDYMQSRDSYARLQNDMQFMAQFTDKDVDRFRRIPEDASQETFYSSYKEYVLPTYDTTDSVYRLEIRALTPESATKASQFLISYAERRLANESNKVQEDAVKNAQREMDEANTRLVAAQDAVLSMKEGQSSASPTAHAESLIAQIEETRALKAQKELALRAMLAADSPNKIRVDALKRDIQNYESQIEIFEKQSLEENADGLSLAELDQHIKIAEAELVAAQANLELKNEMLASAKSTLINQGKYLTTTLEPTASFEPIYPKKLTSLMAAFFIFFAIYIFLSMLVEVLKEQVTA